MAGQDLNPDFSGGPYTLSAVTPMTLCSHGIAVNKYSRDDVYKWWPTCRSLSFEGAQNYSFDKTACCEIEF